MSAPRVGALVVVGAAMSAEMPSAFKSSVSKSPEDAGSLSPVDIGLNLNFASVHCTIQKILKFIKGVSRNRMRELECLRDI